MLGFYPISAEPISGFPQTPGSAISFDRSAMPRIIFNARAPTTSKFEYFDFTSMLQSAETISSAGVAVAVISGTDADPSGLLSGSAVISGSKVRQMFTGGVTGTIYGAICTVVTSLGQTLQLGAYIAVVGDN